MLCHGAVTTGIFLRKRKVVKENVLRIQHVQEFLSFFGCDLIDVHKNGIRFIAAQCLDLLCQQTMHQRVTADDQLAIFRLQTQRAVGHLGEGRAVMDGSKCRQHKPAKLNPLGGLFVPRLRQIDGAVGILLQKAAYQIQIVMIPMQMGKCQIRFSGKGRPAAEQTVKKSPAGKPAGDFAVSGVYFFAVMVTVILPSSQSSEPLPLAPYST